MASAQLVRVPYAQLCEPSTSSSLHAAVEAAFGPDGLGILVVDDVPGYEAARAALLPLALQLATLPEAEKAALEDPESHWNFGWSHGRERLEGERTDFSKGSFYANPLMDAPTDDPQLAAKYPHYCRPNLWPSNALPALEPALKRLGTLMTATGLLLARHCDSYVAAKAQHPSAACLEATMQQSRCVKARLLHYFPLGDASDAAEDAGEADVSSWCGWHLDHGSLTALTCAQYSDASGAEVPCPDEGAGLYIRARDGRTLRAAFHPCQLAFQMGEASQVQSGGLLVATPHCVRAARGPQARGVARNAFAVFMQPNYDAPLAQPDGAQGGVSAWRPGMDFGEFAAAKLAGYH